MKDNGAEQGAGQLVAVVVTYNRRDKLEATLARLLAASADHLAHVVVVDNASTDGTADWLAAQADPRLTIIRHETNLGGAGGFATGIRAAVERFDPDWVVVMDDDARPGLDTFARFHATPRAESAAWAAAVTYPSGVLCEMNRPTLNPFWHAGSFLGALTRGRAGFHIDNDTFHGSEAVPIDAASFVGLFISRAAIARVGYPDASLFIYGDDVLYTLAIRKAGMRISFDPNLGFEHDCESTEPDRKVYHPVWRAFYHHRNLIFVYRRAAGAWFWPALLIILPKWLSLARHYGAEAPAFRRILHAAIRDGLKGDTSRPHAMVLALAAMERPAGQ